MVDLFPCSSHSTLQWIFNYMEACISENQSAFSSQKKCEWVVSGESVDQMGHYMNKIVCMHYHTSHFRIIFTLV